MCVGRSECWCYRLFDPPLLPPDGLGFGVPASHRMSVTLLYMCNNDSDLPVVS